MKLISLWPLFLLVGFVASGTARATTTYESFKPTMTAGTAYTIDALKLHPTQFSVGRREIEHKRTKFDAMSTAEVIAYLQQKDVPVVIGPGGVPYLTDGHHTSSALLVCAHSDKTVYGHILANWSDMADTEFWARMQKQGYTFLFDATGAHRRSAELPASLADMKADSYRGLAWAVMQAGGFEEIKPPAIFFQEFYWADFFRTRLKWNDADETDYARALQEALVLVHSPDAANLPGYISPQP